MGHCCWLRCYILHVNLCREEEQIFEMMVLYSHFRMGQSKHQTANSTVPDLCFAIGKRFIRCEYDAIVLCSVWLERDAVSGD
jgi:hypothetical protein